MTNPNIPPEIADSPAKWKSDDRVCTRWDLCPLAGQLHSHSHSPTPAPAPVRISPEVRETILESLGFTKNRLVERVSQVGVSPIRRQHLVSQIEGVRSAIAFVEALP